LCGFAPSLNVLLALRIFQCLGEAMFSPIGIAIVTVFLPSDVKGRALGFMATTQGLGFCVGPILGGFINAHFGWHGIFFVNVQLCILAIIASWKLIPDRQPLLEDKRIDYKGAFLIFVCLSTLVFALNSISTMGLKNPAVLSCFAVSFTSLALFIFQELRSPNPILYLELFLKRDFTAAVLSAFSVIFVYMGLIFLFPFYLTIVRGIDIVRAGSVLMIPALMVIISAPIAGLLSDKVGCRPVCIFGITMTTIGFFMFSMMTVATSINHVITSLVLAGIAIGCFLPANNKLVMMLAPEDKQGMASAVYKILNSTGGVFGIAILPLIIMRKIAAVAAASGMPMSEAKAHPEIVMSGFDAAFKFAMFLCVTGFVFTVLARDKKS